MPPGRMRFTPASRRYAARPHAVHPRLPPLCRPAACGSPPPPAAYVLPRAASSGRMPFQFHIMSRTSRAKTRDEEGCFTFLLHQPGKGDGRSQPSLEDLHFGGPGTFSHVRKYYVNQAGPWTPPPTAFPAYLFSPRGEILCKPILSIGILPALGPPFHRFFFTSGWDKKRIRIPDAFFQVPSPGR